jgi:hypothetical protein
MEHALFLRPEAGCGLNACKRHVGITFFRGTELADPRGLFTAGRGIRASRASRLKTLSGFNRDAFSSLLLSAVELDAQPQIAPPPK